MPVTDLRPFVSLRFGPQCVDVVRIFVGSESQPAAPSTEGQRSNGTIPARFVFGNFIMNLDVLGYEREGFGFLAPLTLTIVYPTTGNVELDASRSPVLLVSAAEVIP